jgi:uncharacterized membrane protein YkoI
MKFTKRKTGSVMAAALLVGLPIGGLALANRNPAPAAAVSIAPPATDGQAAQAAKAILINDAQQEVPQAQQPTPVPEADDANEPAETDQDAEVNDATEVGQDAGEQESVITGSIPAPAESATEQDDAAEQAALQGLATLSPEQATAAAIAANPGTTATKVELGNENGFVVYDIKLDNGLDIMVDAGDGKVLYTEKTDPNDGPEAGPESDND